MGLGSVNDVEDVANGYLLTIFNVDLIEWNSFI